MSRMRPTMPWIKLAPVGDIITDCEVGNAQLADSAVTEPKLSFSDVTTKNATTTAHGLLPKLSGDSTQFLNGDGEWTGPTATVADCSIDSSKLADSAVTAAGIADSAVVTAKMSDCAVTYAKIQNVTAARLLGRYDGAAGVTQEITLAGGLTFDSNAGTISSDTTIALAADQVDSSAIATNAVSTEALQDSAVTSAELGDTAVITTKINNDAVTYAKIQNVAAQRLLARQDAASGDVQEVPLSAEMRFDTDNDWLEIADSGITTGLIADSAVTTAKLNDSAITTGKLNDAGVTASKLYDTSIVTRVVEIHATDTSLAVGDTLATFFVPAELNNYDLVRAEACVKVISTSGRPTVQIRDVTGAADMMSVKITIDSGEKTSYTSDTASVVDTTNDTVVTGQEIAIDIDSAGTGTEDLYLILSFRKP